MGTSQCFDIHSGKILRTWKNKLLELETIFPVWPLVFSPDNLLLATAGPILLWDKETAELKKRQLRPGAVYDMAFSPDGKIVATGGADTAIHFWDATSGKNVRILEGHAKSVGGLSFTPNGGMLASCSLDGSKLIWSIQ